MYKKIIIFGSMISIIIIVYFCTQNKHKTNYIDNTTIDKNVINTIDNTEEITSEDDILGNLTIEKIGLNGKVKDGSSKEVLNNYIGHIEDTPIYDGNVCLAAHNRGNQFSYFSRLNELEKGDIVNYETKFGNKLYQITNISVILETDWTLLKNTKEDMITMITCIKNKPNQRLCVQAIEKKG